MRVNCQNFSVWSLACLYSQHGTTTPSRRLRAPRGRTGPRITGLCPGGAPFGLENPYVMAQPHYRPVRPYPRRGLPLPPATCDDAAASQLTRSTPRAVCPSTTAHGPQGTACQHHHPCPPPPPRTHAPTTAHTTAHAPPHPLLTTPMRERGAHTPLSPPLCTALHPSAPRRRRSGLLTLCPMRR